MRNLLTFALFLALGALLAGCRVPAGSTPTPTSTFAFVTATPTAVAQAPSPTFTPLSTSTPVPTPAPPATPTQTPVPLPTLPNTPTPILATPTPSTPHAIIDSPRGFLNVFSGPGYLYPPIGAYDNGAVVEIIGKQYSSERELWWLISFAGDPFGQGWILADETIAYNIENVPWVSAPPPPPPPPPIDTPVPPPRIPSAIINSPDGVLYVRTGPGRVYQPPLGAYNNGALVEVIGKQYDTNGDLWWLILFPTSPNGEGWIYAKYTIAYNVNNVPWVTAPPTPTVTPTPSVTPTSVPTPAVVSWTITGRAVKAGTTQPVAGAFVSLKLGNDGTFLTTTTDANGQFVVVANAHDSGDLVITITAGGYQQKTITAGPASPRVYNFPNIELSPQTPPTVTWAIFGRVIEIGTSSPIEAAQVEAILGTEAVHIQTVTDANGQFSMNGQARNEGTLSLTVTAEGYQPKTITSDQTDSRVYNLPDIQLVPQAGSCAYESVISLTQPAAIARLQSLSFTAVSTQTVDVGGNQSLVGRVVTQEPDPPPEGQTKRISCQVSITLGIGVGGTQ